MRKITMGGREGLQRTLKVEGGLPTRGNQQCLRGDQTQLLLLSK